MKTNDPLNLKGTIFNRFWASNLQENFIGKTKAAKKLYVVCGEPTEITIVAMTRTERDAEKLAKDLNDRMEKLK